jgi:hypothetical protein
MMPDMYSRRGPVRSLEQHEEWLLDDAIDHTFPASDPVSHGQPGSIGNLRYAALERRARRRLPAVPRATPVWLALASVVVCALLVVRVARRRPSAPH